MRVGYLKKERYARSEQELERGSGYIGTQYRILGTDGLDLVLPAFEDELDARSYANRAGITLEEAR